jgi:hypothetical protein
MALKGSKWFRLSSTLHMSSRGRFGPRAEVLKRLMSQPRPAEVAPVARLEGSGAAAR